MPPRIAGARAPDLRQVAAEAILGTPGEPGKSRGLHPVRIEAFRGRRVRRDIREQARETVLHVDETRQSLDAIMQQVATISASSGGIASAATRQGHGIGDIKIISTDDNSIRLGTVSNRSTFFQELGIRYHIKIISYSTLIKHFLNPGFDLVCRTYRHCTFVYNNFVAFHMSGNGFSHR